MKLSQRRVCLSASLIRPARRSRRAAGSRTVRKTRTPARAVRYLHVRFSFRRLPCFVPEHLGAIRFVSLIDLC